jgi:hypothetical protein
MRKGREAEMIYFKRYFSHAGIDFILFKCASDNILPSSAL